MKKILGILDICSIGGTSTNTFILSTGALKNEPVTVPTYLFSYQTEMNKKFIKVNNNDYFKRTLEQYIEDKIVFDGVLIGYVDEKQIQILNEYLPKLINKDSIVILDPVLLEGDSKKKIDELNKLSNLCSFITPNSYELKTLNLNTDKIIQKSIRQNKQIGFLYNNTYYLHPYINKEFYGCGDLFASLLLNLLVNEHDIYDSIDIASKTLYKILKNTSTRDYTIDIENNLKILCKIK